MTPRAQSVAKRDERWSPKAKRPKQHRRARGMTRIVSPGVSGKIICLLMRHVYCIQLHTTCTCWMSAKILMNFVIEKRGPSNSIKNSLIPSNSHCFPFVFCTWSTSFYRQNLCTYSPIHELHVCDYHNLMLDCFIFSSDFEHDDGYMICCDRCL